MGKEIPIFRSLDLIEERIQEKLTVEKLAESIHFSKYHYQRLFREIMGESVMKYVNARRMALAAEELAGNRESILAIALRYGFDSHEGFTRSFKAYMGITPTEYRKYHLSVRSPGKRKERDIMTNSNAAEEMIREMNGLIAKARETAAETRRQKDIDPETAAVYGPFWNFIAARTEIMADELTENLDAITHIGGCPDKISVRFVIIKAIEDAAFQLDLTAFQAKLMMSRAKKEHRMSYESLCRQYGQLAGSARMKSGKIVALFNELADLIFRDIRKNAEENLQKAVAMGRAAVETLSQEPEFPYGYIVDEVRRITEELSAVSVKDMTADFLEGLILRLDIIIFASESEIFRTPSHKPLFEGLTEWKVQLEAAAEWFWDLSEDMAGELAGQEKGIMVEQTVEKRYSDIAFQGNILLFYLRGEIQKLGKLSDEEQKSDFDHVCGKFDGMIQLAYGACGNSAAGEIKDILQEIWEELMKQAEKLGEYGGPVRFLAGEVDNLCKAL